MYLDVMNRKLRHQQIMNLCIFLLGFLDVGQQRLNILVAKEDPH